MFGMLTPCSHGARTYGIDPTQWRAHLCGLCLGLRDGHGQAARAATNTDAVLLSVLTEVQAAGAPEREQAGPCPLRGMRGARVAGATSPGVRLAATASLLLGAATVRDHIADADAPALVRRPMNRLGGRWAEHARDQADRIGLDLSPLVAAIAGQAELEQRAARAPGTVSLEELTAPTRLCAAEFFAHSAVLAGRPENAGSLRVAGDNFGRIAHLADAVEDLAQDTARGRFNPLTATGTDPLAAHDLLRAAETGLRRELAAVELAQVPLLRWLLLDPLSSLVHRLGHRAGAPLSCSTRPVDPPSTAAGDPLAVSAHAAYPGPHHHRHQQPRKPTLIEGIGLALGQYPTGYACFADHRRPCSGRRKKAWRKRVDCCDCGCDCCCDC